MTMPVSEVEALSQCVGDFAEAMRRKLWKKLREGYGGWNDDSDPDVIDSLRDKLHEHVKRYFGPGSESGSETDPKQLVDIANLVMMLWRIEVWRVEVAGKEKPDAE